MVKAIPASIARPTAGITRNMSKTLVINSTTPRSFELSWTGLRRIVHLDSENVARVGARSGVPAGEIERRRREIRLSDIRKFVGVELEKRKVRDVAGILHVIADGAIRLNERGGGGADRAGAQSGIS